MGVLKNEQEVFSCISGGREAESISPGGGISVNTCRELQQERRVARERR